MKLSAFIDGKAIKSSKEMEIRNPSNDALLGTVPACSKANIDEAFMHAQKAFLKYRSSTLIEREALLNKVANALSTHKDELATLLSQEVAKAFKDSLVEIERSVDYIKETIDEYKKIISHPRTYSEAELKTTGLNATYHLEPLGVVLAITPFNYPINLLVAKLAPALICGNTIVIKSPSSGSLVTSKFIQFIHEQGIPNGLISLITGAGREIGDYIVMNENIKLISFTGSTNIAKKIAKEQSLTPLVLENGGKDPAIVFSDVDVNVVAKEIAKGAFSYSGQRCTAIKRVIAHKTIAPKLIIALNKIIGEFVVGDPFVPGVTITPLINTSSLKYNLEILHDAEQKGAKLHQKIRNEGNLLWPVLISEVKQNMMIWKEEPFGPILPIITFDTDEKAIELANDSNYGLQASIFSADINKAKSIANEIQAGTVNINKSSSRGPDILPFFGIKDSGFGMQGIRESILSSSRLKGIVIKK